MGKPFSKSISNYQETFPLTEEEKEILHTRHHLTREIFKGNFSSPVHNELQRGWAKVLDVGCDVGTWLFELSADYPGCTYIGTYTSPYSSLATVGRPFDVEFIEADPVRGLPFKDETFDFVSMKNRSIDYNETEWKNIMNELVRVLKPGGWLEDYMHMTSELRKIQHEIQYLPLGPFAGRFGETSAQFAKDTLKAFLPKLANYFGVRIDDIDSIISTILEEAEENQSHVRFHRFFAQKETVLDLTS
ncbi:13087_t:CDS:2 [Cetraspora pellucida]|uniref:13087_t:CDS:1 n=1 Tax=Cetraspora pellucida TaxID=1433469 RepID=A0A9N9CU63_9GLOM|nr:13087_t:CDS:2 [Cetraspora pellucida]